MTALGALHASCKCIISHFCIYPANGLTWRFGFHLILIHYLPYLPFISLHIQHLHQLFAGLLNMAHLTYRWTHTALLLYETFRAIGLGEGSIVLSVAKLDM